MDEGKVRIVVVGTDSKDIVTLVREEIFNGEFEIYTEEEIEEIGIVSNRYKFINDLLNEEFIKMESLECEDVKEYGFLKGKKMDRILGRNRRR